MNKINLWIDSKTKLILESIIQNEIILFYDREFIKLSYKLQNEIMNKVEKYYGKSSIEFVSILYLIAISCIEYLNSIYSKNIAIIDQERIIFNNIIEQANSSIRYGLGLCINNQYTKKLIYILLLLASIEIIIIKRNLIEKQSIKSLQLAVELLKEARSSIYEMIEYCNNDEYLSELSIYRELIDSKVKEFNI